MSKKILIVDDEPDIIEFLKYNLEPFIVQIPDGLDPDDWITKNGEEEINKGINKAIGFHVK